MSKYYEEYIRSELGNLEKFKIEPKGELTIVLSEKKSKKSFSEQGYHLFPIFHKNQLQLNVFSSSFQKENK